MAADRGLRITFLTWRDSGHPDGGGSEVYVESVAAELARRGHHVDIVCARYPGSTAEDRVRGVRIHRRGGRLGVYPRALWWTVTTGRRRDVVVDVINGVPFLTPLVRRSGVVGLVHHLHREQWQMIYPDLRGRFGWWVESRLVPRIYRSRPLVTVSRSTRDDLVALGFRPEGVAVAHNGLDVLERSCVPREEHRLAVLARLVPHKRIEQALAVVSTLRSEFPDIFLDVIGEGWWRGELEAHARDLGVRDRVRFWGHVTDARRDELLAGAAVMVMPSVREGWCLAVMEAAAQATPTIAYATAGGVTESVVHGRTGLLVADLDAMVAATRGLLVDEARARRLGERAQARSREFSWASTADVFEDVLSSRAGRPDLPGSRWPFRRRGRRRRTR